MQRRLLYADKEGEMVPGTDSDADETARICGCIHALRVISSTCAHERVVCAFNVIRRYTNRRRTQRTSVPGSVKRTSSCSLLLRVSATAR